MLTGKVVRFDEVRGYGFIAPDGGGEDVFVHANVLGDDKYVFGPGLRVEFEAADGDRGPKAYAVHLLPDRGPAPVAALVAPPVIPPDLVPPLSAAPQAVGPGTAAAPSGEPESGEPESGELESGEQESGDEELCDVLTAAAFSQEITELLLRSAPAVTAAQILNVRADLIGFGRQHGWIEG